RMLPGLLGGRLGGRWNCDLQIVSRMSHSLSFAFQTEQHLGGLETLKRCLPFFPGELDQKALRRHQKPFPALLKEFRDGFADPCVKFAAPLSYAPAVR